VGFEPTVSAGERPKTYALDRAGTAIGGLCRKNINVTFPVARENYGIFKADFHGNGIAVMYECMRRSRRTNFTKKIIVESKDRDFFVYVIKRGV